MAFNQRQRELIEKMINDAIAPINVKVAELSAEVTKLTE